MKMKFMNYVGFLGLATMALAISAEENTNGGGRTKDNWGLVQGVYNVGASQFVAKDFGSLEMGIEVRCAQADAIPQQMGELVNLVKGEVQKNSAFVIKSEN